MRGDIDCEVAGDGNFFAFSLLSGYFGVECLLEAPLVTVQDVNGFL